MNKLITKLITPFCFIICSAFTVNLSHVGHNNYIIDIKSGSDKINKYTHYTLKNPTRFIIDLEDKNLRININKVQEQIIKKHIGNINYIQNNKTRLIIEPNPENQNKFHSQVEQINDFHIKLHITDKNKKPILQTAKKNKTTKPNNQAKKVNKTVPNIPLDNTPIINNDKKNDDKKSDTLPQYETIKLNDVKINYDELHSSILKDLNIDFLAQKYKIVIDPGHGGKDTGTTVCKGVYEKDLNLQISKKLANNLLNLGYKIFLTRSTDAFISLTDRIAVANNNNADLIISVHCNSEPSGTKEGILIYTITQSFRQKKQRSDAMIQNKSIIQNTSESADLTGIEDFVFNFIEQNNDKTSESLAKLIIEHLKKDQVCQKDKICNTRHNAQLVVLKSVDTPSILIESGFLSNETDAKRLMSEEYQKNLAHTVANAVDKFIKNNNLEYAF